MKFITTLGGKRIYVEVDERQPQFEFQLLRSDNQKPIPLLARLLPRFIRERFLDEYRVMRMADHYDIA